jgi:hypothetical protein
VSRTLFLPLFRTRWRKPLYLATRVASTTPISGLDDRLEQQSGHVGVLDSLSISIVYGAEIGITDR